MLYSGRLRPYPQTLDLAGKACQGQILIQKLLNYGRKKFYKIGPRSKLKCLSLSTTSTLVQYLHPMVDLTRVEPLMGGSKRCPKILYYGAKGWKRQTAFVWFGIIFDRKSYKIQALSRIRPYLASSISGSKSFFYGKPSSLFDRSISDKRKSFIMLTGF